MKVSEMHERRKALLAERDSILASTEMTVEQEARGHEVANELTKLDGEIRAAQLRERFASYTAVEKTVNESRERNADWIATTEYRDQFLGWCRGGRAPESREINTGSSSGVLIPKIYQDGILKYLSANTVVRNLADLRTGVKGYQVLRYNTLETASYTGAWAVNDQTATTAAVSIDPGFAEVPIDPIACLPYTQVSKQSIVQSDFDLEAEVMDNLQRQLAKNLEWGYVGGPGSSSSTVAPIGTTNGPTGIFKVDANVNITTATSAGTTRAQAITAGATLDKLREMRYSKLPAAYWGSSAWILPQDVYAAIAALTVNNVPLFIPSADAVGQAGAGFTLMGLPVYVTEYLPAHVATATTGKNVIAVLGNIRDSFSVREWGGMSMMRDEISQATSARVRFYGMAFANSKVTRAKAMVQLQVTNA
jgi:HK97 family phage major capsid protein